MDVLSIYLAGLRGGLMEARRTNYKPMDVVGVQTRNGFEDSVIVGIRMINRGRYQGMKEYTLAPMNRTGKWYAFKVKGDSILGKPRGKYTKTQIRAAAMSQQKMANSVDARRQAKRDRGREALGGHGGTKIAAGDEVLVNYRDGKRWERVAFVNFKTGKVAIFRSGYRQSSSSQNDLLNQLIGKRPRRTKDTRYIHPDHILEVRPGKRV